MSLFFLDRNKTISTCNRKNCINCIIKKKIRCHFNFFYLFCFLLIIFPSLIIGGLSILYFNLGLLIFWIFLCITFFGFIEIRVMCSHCPHYAEDSISILKCWANYGAPKIWKYRPGPMSLFEKTIFFSGLVVIFFYPVIFIILNKNFFYMPLYIFFIITGAIFLQMFYCRYCMNIACPLNRVDKETRDLFLKNNPQIKKEWNK